MRKKTQLTQLWPHFPLEIMTMILHPYTYAAPQLM